MAVHDNLLLVIAFLVLVVLALSGWRQWQRQRRNAIRMNLRPGDAPVVAMDETDTWGSELPNGPARIRPRHGGEAPATVADPVARAVADGLEIPTLVRRVATENAAVARRHRAESRAAMQASGQRSLLAPGGGEAEAVAEQLFVLKVLPRDAEGFDGNAVLQILLACDLRYGSMNIFHRHEESRGRGPVQFSVARLDEPGTFDLEAMPDQRLPGLCFIMTLPGAVNSLKAFNYMVETAQCIVKNLGGDLLDEAHSAVTLQTLEHARQRIRDFERLQLVPEA